MTSYFLYRSINANLTGVVLLIPFQRKSLFCNGKWQEVDPMILTQWQGFTSVRLVLLLILAFAMIQATAWIHVSNRRHISSRHGNPPQRRNYGRPKSFAVAMTPRNDDNDNKGNENLGAAAATVAVVSLSSIAVVLWSEIAIFRTGCGPIYLPDVLERSSYLIVLGASSISMFTRIVTAFGPSVMNIPRGFANFVLQCFDYKFSKYYKGFIVSLQVTETLALLAAVGAIVVLANQAFNGETMDGMSGIDLSKCRARQTFELILY